ncbi:hypothetical protein IMG5_171250 [Ichthyophthirius multifiliis]|uniref:Uncharacterized protein n=1 Tax=Ichthyophthirius multifiliis TaxID=5932 RepID=G0R1L3_ICHMU|nr:hypothetical protein IMG5_171250 [Ichthyophthirius multifiliis]EGR28642.1 hypothetical protein IMG5_171250 [Ichthyophthirius multifiliis]|eukprot:XP_004029878.1 hypothetical protein IMG5_171250 [Ichthyophthirius multifiliis]
MLSTKSIYLQYLQISGKFSNSFLLDLLCILRILILGFLCKLGKEEPAIQLYFNRLFETSFNIYSSVSGGQQGAYLYYYSIYSIYFIYLLEMYPGPLFLREFMKFSEAAQSLFYSSFLVLILLILWRTFYYFSSYIFLSIQSFSYFLNSYYLKIASLILLKTYRFFQFFYCRVLFIFLINILASCFAYISSDILIISFI